MRVRRAPPARGNRALHSRRPLVAATTQQLDSDQVSGADAAPNRAETDAGRPARKTAAGLGPILAALHEVAAEKPIPVVARFPAPAASNDAALPDAAIRDAEAALEPVPDRAHRDAKFFYARGLIAYRFGDFARALVNYDAALRLDPSFERAYRDRSAVFALTSRYDRAAADLAQAERIRRAHSAINHQRSKGSVAQAALWRQNQRARAANHVDDHAASHLLLSKRTTMPWHAGG